MRESDTYQAIVEEGIAKGLVLGRAEGELKTAHATLLRLGTRRWGEPDSATRRRLDAIHDVEQLQALTDRVLDASGWEELLREHGPAK